MIIYLSLLVCLLGLVIYFINSPGKEPAPRAATWAEVGRIMFAMGLLAFLLLFSGGSVVGVLHR